MQRVGIVASAQTEFKEQWSGAQHIDLIYQAVRRCLKGTGLGIDDIDFVIDSGSDVLDGRSISNCGFLGSMGANHKEESRVEDDGAWAAMYSYMKIASGIADVGLVVAYSKASEADLNAFYRLQSEPFVQRPIGIDKQMAAGLVASRYVDSTQMPVEALGQMAAHDWAAAAKNDNLPGFKAHSVEEIVTSPLVASPLTALMLSRPMDGAVCVLMASEPIARRCASKPVWVAGIGSAMDVHLLGSREPIPFAACRKAAERAYKMASVADPRRDFAAVELAPNSAADEFMLLEALGLASTGEAWKAFTGDGEPNLSVAINPSGGGLPADVVFATGLVRIAETAGWLTREGRHRSEGRTTRALAHAATGLGLQNHCVFVLEAD